MSLRAEDILGSPDFFPLRFDGPNLVFVRMSRDSYFRSIFTLPNRIVTANNDTWSVPFADLVELFEQANLTQSPAAWIFQIAHCGSTLLSRALDKPGSSLVVRESFALRQFAASPRPIDVVAVDTRKRGLRVLLQLLNRQYQSEESVVIKANVPVNYAIDEILELAPISKGILLHSSLDDYLLAILKTQQRQQWVQHVVKELAPKIAAVPGFETLNIESLNATQAAAVLWSSQLHRYHVSLASASNLASLLSDDLYTSPAQVIAASAQHLELPFSASQADEIAASDLFNHHSKIPSQAYTQQMRVDQLDQLREQFANQLDQVKAWCIDQNIGIETPLGDIAKAVF